MLRSLLEIAEENARFQSLVAGLADAPVEAYVSTPLRPFLLAALVESKAYASRPALLVTADDRSARDLASDLHAFLAPRRVHLYPSRGTGYLSHVAPPPHLAGLRVPALTPLT